MKLREMLERVDQLAPFDTQEAFDNCGLLLGDPEKEIETVLLALDCTQAVAEEAIRIGAGLVITHHPLMFSPVKTLREDNAEARILCTLIRAGIALIAAHTCLDKAPGGINDVLAQTMGLSQIRGEGFLRLGDLPEAMQAGDVQKLLAEKLDTTVRLMGDAKRMIHTVGMCSGAGSEEWEAAHASGAEAFVSGEIKHHHALAAAAEGVVCFEC